MRAVVSNFFISALRSALRGRLTPSPRSRRHPPPPSRDIRYPTSASASISLWQMRKKSTHAATHLGGQRGSRASPQTSRVPPPRRQLRRRKRRRRDRRGQPRVHGVLIRPSKRVQELRERSKDLSRTRGPSGDENDSHEFLPGSSRSSTAARPALHVALADAFSPGATIVESSATADRIASRSIVPSAATAMARTVLSASLAAASRARRAPNAARTQTRRRDVRLLRDGIRAQHAAAAFAIAANVDANASATAGSWMPAPPGSPTPAGFASAPAPPPPSTLIASAAVANASKHAGWWCAANVSRRDSSTCGRSGVAARLAHRSARMYTSPRATTAPTPRHGSAANAERTGHAAEDDGDGGVFGAEAEA